MAISRVAWEEEISLSTPNLAEIKEDWRPRVEIGDDFACDWGGEGGDFTCCQRRRERWDWEKKKALRQTQIKRIISLIITTARRQPNSRNNLLQKFFVYSNKLNLYLKYLIKHKYFSQINLKQKLKKTITSYAANLSLLLEN